MRITIILKNAESKEMGEGKTKGSTTYLNIILEVKMKLIKENDFETQRNNHR